MRIGQKGLINDRGFYHVGPVSRDNRFEVVERRQGDVQIVFYLAGKQVATFPDFEDKEGTSDLYSTRHRFICHQITAPFSFSSTSSTAWIIAISTVGTAGHWSSTWCRLSASMKPASARRACSRGDRLPRSPIWNVRYF